MKKSLITIAILATSMGTGLTALAQQAAPANAPQTAAPATKPNISSTLNPFTGVSKNQIEAEKTSDELKRLRILSTDKLALQRDEVEALRVELEKKKLLDALNPPPPPPPPAPVVPPKGSKKVSVNTINSDGTPVAPKVVKPPEPAQIFAASPAKFTPPEVIGVIDSTTGQKFALVSFDGQTLRAQQGSTIGGQSVQAINASGIQWGDRFLSVSTARAVPTVMVTDIRTGPVVAKPAATPPPMPIPSPAAPVQTQYRPGNYQVNSGGAQVNSGGASGPTGVLGILPPPPPSVTR